MAHAVGVQSEMELACAGVHLVFAARDPGAELAGLPELEVGGLRDHDARALLEAALAGPLDARVRDQIIAETRGNPLALLELPRGLSPAELAGGFGLPGTVPLAGRIEESFARQLDALPAETRRLLQLAAADPSGDASLVWRAAGRLGIPVQVGTPAVEAGLGSLYHISAEVRRAPPAAEPVRPSDLLLDGFALLLTEGRQAATPFLQRASAGFAGADAAVEEVLRWGWLATVGAAVVWDYESCVAIGSRGVRLARDLGALTVLAVALNILTEAVAMGGDFGWAERLIAEADAVTEATGTQVLQYGALFSGRFRAGKPTWRDSARSRFVTLPLAAKEPLSSSSTMPGRSSRTVLGATGRRCHRPRMPPMPHPN